MRTYCELTAANDALTWVLLQAAGLPADTVMRDYATLAAVLATCTEASFTNYTRKPFTTGIVSPGQSSITPDNTADTLAIDFPDPTWAAAGGATNNTLGKLLLCYVPDTTVAVNNAVIVPLLFWDYITTTDGTTRSAQVNTAGAWRSTRPA